MRRRLLLQLPMLALLRPLRARAEVMAEIRAEIRAEVRAKVMGPSPRLVLTAADLEVMPEGLRQGLRLRPGPALPVLRSDLAPDLPSDLAPIDPGDTSPEAGALRRAVGRGLAAGLAGVVYDNRDRGHSVLPAGMFPPMTRLVYGPDLKAQGLDYGLAVPILLPGSGGLAPVIGNSSTAVTAGPAPRSLPRLAMTVPGGPERAWAAYAGNQTYVYPEHRDHDAADLFAANWPYMLISQGSSYSDQPFLRAVGLILGALPPATRAAARTQGLIGPTVQMVFRRGLVRGTAAYLSGAAHPTVFDGATLMPAPMLALAQSLSPGDLPPLVRLQVLAEDFAPAAGLAELSERLFDTPAAIARIWRGPAHGREMLVSAALTEGAAAVTRWHWVLLRGDPARVRIVPQGSGGSARIVIDWHAAAALAAGPARTGSRLDIGVFAETATGQLSAPAFVSVSFPLHEARVYGPGPPAAGGGAGGDLGSGGPMRLLSVDYDAVGRGQAYDPLLHWSAPWRDDFTWAPDGRLAGWRRTAVAPEGAAAAGDYDAAGRRDGRPVLYERAGPEQQPVLQLR